MVNDCQKHFIKQIYSLCKHIASHITGEYEVRREGQESQLLDDDTIEGDCETPILSRHVSGNCLGLFLRMLKVLDKENNMMR